MQTSKVQLGRPKVQLGRVKVQLGRPKVHPPYFPHVKATSAGCCALLSCRVLPYVVVCLRGTEVGLRGTLLCLSVSWTERRVD